MAGLALLVVGLNFLVDPYDVFGAPRIPGISLYKPAPKNHAMLAKTYQVARAHPVTVLIGSSSTHIGIDASDPAWPAAMRPVYNYGIPGATTTFDALRTLEEAVALGGVRNAFVFIDFENFLSPTSPPTGLSEDERRFHLLADGSPNPYRPAQVARDKFLSLATLGALIHSIETIAGQIDPTVLNLGTNGSSNGADFSNAARNDGMYDLFAQKLALESGRSSMLARAMEGWLGSLPNVNSISAMIALARAHNVRLTLVIVPHHADALELYWRNGLWPRVEQFKTEVAALVASEGSGVTLWDFLDYSTLNTEPVPPPGDRRSQTKWYWEPAHFKKTLGHVMIERVTKGAGPDFGTLLTPENVRARNEAIRAQRQTIVCGHREPPLPEHESRPEKECLRAEGLPRPPG